MNIPYSIHQLGPLLRVSRLLHGGSFLLAAMLTAGAAAGQERRTVSGIVLDREGAPVQGAVVKLKSLAFLYVRSYITQQDGRIAFFGLNPDADYEVRARKENAWSSRTQISRFSSRQKVEVTLRLRTIKGSRPMRTSAALAAD
jgi:hypothetical protein